MVNHDLSIYVHSYLHIGLGLECTNIFTDAHSLSGGVEVVSLPSLLTTTCINSLASSVLALPSLLKHVSASVSGFRYEALGIIRCPRDQRSLTFRRSPPSSQRQERNWFLSGGWAWSKELQGACDGSRRHCYLPESWPRDLSYGLECRPSTLGFATCHSHGDCVGERRLGVDLGW